MKLTFYWSNNEPTRLDKSGNLTSVGEVSGVQLKETTEPLSPQFVFKKNSAVYNSNYFYCDATNRYYFLDKNSIEMMPGQRISIRGIVDVLYSFCSDIKASPAWIEVADGTPTSEEQLIDQTYPFTNEYETTSVDFPNQPLGVSQGQQNFFLIMSP